METPVFELCGRCANRRMKHGDSVCVKQPFDYETREQRDIVAWLQASQVCRKGDCPSFVPA